LRAHISPGQLGGVALGPHFDLFAVDRDKVVARLDVVGKVAQNRVVLEQVSQRRRAGQVVDGDKIDFFVAKRGPQNVASDAAEAVDTNLYCHVSFLLRGLCGMWFQNLYRAASEVGLKWDSTKPLI